MSLLINLLSLTMSCSCFDSNGTFNTKSIVAFSAMATF